MPTYTTTLGELVEYPKPPANVARFLERAQAAAEDPRVTEDGLIALIYGTENPLLEQGKFKDRGAVTKEVLANPLYRVFLDLLDHKRIALGKTTAPKLEAAFTDTVADVAKRYGVTPGGVRKAILSKRLVAIEKPNGYLIDPRSAEACFGGERKARGYAKGPALTLAFGNVTGASFRVKFANLRFVEKKKLKDGKLDLAEVDSFQRAAIHMTGKEMGRVFIIEPAARKRRYDFEGLFYVVGLFKIVEKVNDAKKASEAFRAFEPS